MSKASQEPVSKADPLDGRFAPSGFFNLTTTARDKVRKKRKRKGLGPQKPKNYPSFTQFLVSGTAAVMSKALLTPFERIKTVMQVQHLNSVDPSMKAKGSIGVMTKIIREQGAGALYRGNMSFIYSLTARMFSNIIFYDRFKYKLMPAGDSKYSGFDKFARRFIAAILAGATTLGLSYPFTLCFTRLTADMNGRGQRRLYLNSFDCFNMTQLHGGYKSMYSGSSVAFASLLPSTLIMIPIYDSISRSIEKVKQTESPSNRSLIMERIGASTITAIIVMALFYPLDTITKCMQVIGSKGYSSVEKGLINTIKSIHKANGYSGFYKGIHLAVIKAVPSVYLQLLIYDYLRQFTIMSDVEIEIQSKDAPAEVVQTYIPQESAVA